jgi:hypothetical protein
MSLRASVGSTEATSDQATSVSSDRRAQKECRLPVLWFGADEKRAADFLTTTVAGQGIY